MSFSAKILADSLSPDGVRLTTMEVTFPRIILSEFNTHRMFSRNSASSRAIPVEKMIKMVQENPYIPTHWGKNQKGMQADVELDDVAAKAAMMRWEAARDNAVAEAKILLYLGVHKQITNRLLEPFMWHTCIVTATEWDNFFHLRDNPQAHPEIQKIAHMMRELYESSTPEKLNYGKWHMPLVELAERQEWAHSCAKPEYPYTDGLLDPMWQKVSVARCARVSYLTHSGTRDLQADLDLHDKLLVSGHLSPFEHVARPATAPDWDADSLGLAMASHTDLDWSGVEAMTVAAPPATQWHGNLRGWVSARKLIPNEADILGTPR